MKASATSPLRIRSFRWLILGEFISDLGTEMMPVALAGLLIAQQGILQLGLVLMVRGLVSSALGIVAGVYVDRSRKTRVLVLTNVVQALVAFGYVFSGKSLALVLVLGVVSGAASAAVGPASGALLPVVLSANHLQAGNAIRGIAGRTAGIAGPALGGVLVVVGRDVPFIVNGLSYCTAIVALLLIVEQKPRRGDRATVSFFSDLSQGFREVVSRRWILTVILVGTIQAPLTVAPGFVILPLAADEQTRPEMYGFALSALALGQVLGGIVTARYRPRFPGLVSFLGVLPFPLALLTVALRLPTPVVLGAFCVAGVGFMLFGVYWYTALQQSVPEDRLSKVLAIDQVGTFGLEPVGYGVAGAVAHSIGPYPVLFFAATTGIVTSVVPLAMPRVWRLSDSAEPPDDSAD